MFKLKDYIMPNIGVFFRHKNTIDVFVEDNYDEEFYKALVNRVFEQTGHTINKLIPLGCKLNVINACTTDQLARKQKRLYIVDGDLDLISGGNNFNLRYLFILEKYCIENYLLEEDAILEILHDTLCVDKEKIAKQLSFKNWLEKLSKNLIDLFLHYSLCKSVRPQTQTVGYAVGRLCSEKNKVHVLDETKINQRIVHLKKEILMEITEDEYNQRLDNLRAQWAINTENLLKIVSGKDYLIPLLLLRFSKFRDMGGVAIHKQSFRLRLAKLCSVTDLTRMVAVID